LARVRSSRTRRVQRRPRSRKFLEPGLPGHVSLQLRPAVDLLSEVLGEVESGHRRISGDVDGPKRPTIGGGRIRVEIALVPVAEDSGAAGRLELAHEHHFLRRGVLRPSIERSVHDRAEQVDRVVDRVGRQRDRLDRGQAHERRVVHDPVVGCMEAPQLGNGGQSADVRQLEASMSNAFSRGTLARNSRFSSGMPSSARYSRSGMVASALRSSRVQRCPSERYRTRASSTALNGAP
jgi:hypothetical protein